MILLKHLLILTLLLLPFWAQAEVPILKENLLSEENQIKTNVGLSYQTSQPATNIYVDSTTTSANARYGWSDKLEFNSSVSARSESTRNSLGEFSTKKQENRFSSLSAGLSYQLDTQILRSFAFLDVTLLEEVSQPDYRVKGFVTPPNRYEKVSGKSWTFGGMLMAVEEPLIYGLNVSTTYNLPYQVGQDVIKPGSSLGVSGTANLLVSQENSIEWGVQWNASQPTVINTKKQGVATTSAAWMLAAQFLIDDDWYGNLSATSQITGTQSFSLSTSVTVDF